MSTPDNVDATMVSTEAPGAGVPWAPIDEPSEYYYDEQPEPYDPPMHPTDHPTPSQAQINAEAEAAIGAKASDRAWQRMQTDAYKQQHAQRQFVKEVDMSDPIIQEKIPICRRLNSYRREYKGKINFQFKADYNPGDPRMTLPILQSWEDQICMCLNTRGVPDMINSLLVIIAGIAEQASAAYDPKVNMVGRLKPKIKEAIARGEFQDEVNQLSIEMAEYFALGPKWRLLHKFTEKMSESYMEAMTPITAPALPNATSATGSKVADAFRTHMDL